MRWCAFFLLALHGEREEGERCLSR
jgi:hypothetical protein